MIVLHTFYIVRVISDFDIFAILVWFRVLLVLIGSIFSVRFKMFFLYGNDFMGLCLKEIGDGPFSR